MDDSHRVRVAFVGAGAICRTRHLPGLKKIDGVELVAVANRSVESGRKIADEFGIGEVMDDWHTLITSDDVDAVFIGTWPYMHCEMSQAVLNAGKHCFCQARMAMDLTEARAMAACAEKHGRLVNMICPPPTRMPFEAFIKDVVSSGRLGTITSVRLISCGGGNLNLDSVHWREKVEYSGKQILAMGIFAETLNAFVGPYESLSAHLATPIPKKAGESIGVPQVVTIAGRLSNGALALEHHSGLASEKSERNELVIQGLQGTLRYTFGKTIELAAKGQALEEVSVPDAHVRDWMVEEDFIAAVRAANRGESWQVSPDFAEGLLYMQKVEAVHEAARTGQTIKLADL